MLIGGTAKAIAKLAKAFLKVEHPERLKIKEFLALRDLICRAGEEEQRLCAALCPDRYELMAAGMTVFAEIFSTLGVKKVAICKGGIREGFLRRHVINGASGKQN